MNEAPLKNMEQPVAVLFQFQFELLAPEVRNGGCCEVIRTLRVQVRRCAKLTVEGAKKIRQDKR